MNYFKSFKGMIRKSNIPVFIYLVMNMLILMGVVWWFMDTFIYPALENEPMPFWKAVIIVVVAYAGILAVAFSPIGEWTLRIFNGCKRIRKPKQIEYIMPLFESVYASAKEFDPNTPDGVKLYVKKGMEPNALAIGRKTICVTEGVFYLPEDQVRAALGHELGHLAHGDPSILLAIVTGNALVLGFVVVLRTILLVTTAFVYIISVCFGGKLGFLIAILNGICLMINTVILGGFTFIWDKITLLLVGSCLRKNEFEADEFSFNLGCGDALCDVLGILGESHAKGLFASLVNHSPERSERIARLRSLQRL